MLLNGALGKKPLNICCVARHITASRGARPWRVSFIYVPFKAWRHCTQLNSTTTTMPFAL